VANIETLLTLGMAHGCDPRRMLLPGTATNELDRLDWTDIHKAMGFCSPAQRAILYLKPLPQMVSEDEAKALENHLRRSLQRFEARRRPARPVDPSPAEAAIYASADEAIARRQAAMVRTALSEYQDPRVCRTCLRSREQGKVMVQVEGQGMVWQTCPRCHGSSWTPWSDNRRAKEIGGDRNAYTTRIAPGYEHLLHTCTVLARSGSDRLMQALFGEAPQHDQIERRLQAGV